MWKPEGDVVGRRRMRPRARKADQQKMARPKAMPFKKAKRGTPYVQGPGKAAEMPEEHDGAEGTSRAKCTSHGGATRPAEHSRKGERVARKDPDRSVRSLHEQDTEAGDRRRIVEAENQLREQ